MTQHPRETKRTRDSRGEAEAERSRQPARDARAHLARRASSSADHAALKSKATPASTSSRDVKQVSSSMHSSAPANVRAGCSDLRDSGGEGWRTSVNGRGEPADGAQSDPRIRGGRCGARGNVPARAGLFARGRAVDAARGSGEAREVHVVEVEVDEIGDVVRVLGAAREGGASASVAGAGRRDGDGAFGRRTKESIEQNRRARTRLA